MVWTSVNSVLLGINWQYTDPVDGSLFRLSQTGTALGDSFLVGQCQVNDDSTVDFQDIQQVFVDGSRQILVFPRPSYFDNRRLALKRVLQPVSLESELRRILNNVLFKVAQPSFYPTPANNWTIQVEVSDMPVEVLSDKLSSSASLPSTTVLKTTVPPATYSSATGATLIVAANPNRKGLIIVNDADGTLSIEFDTNSNYGGQGGSLSVYARQIPPKATYILDVHYTGAICGTWDVTTGVGAFVREFI